MERTRQRTYDLKQVGGATIKKQLKNKANFKDEFFFCRTCTRWCVRVLAWLMVLAGLLLLTIYSGNLEAEIINAFGPKTQADTVDEARIVQGMQDLNADNPTSRMWGNIIN